MIAVVTGASGFIGTHLVDALALRGDHFSCLVRSTSRTEHLTRRGAALVYGDLRDRDSLRAAVAGAEVVFHLAGLIKALRAADLTQVNEFGVRNLAEACAAQPNPPVLVIVSSLAAAGPSHKGRPRTEADPIEPVSYYGRSKRAGELAAEALGAKVPISIVRPPIVLGEGDTSGVSLFRPVARFGIHLVPGFSEARFSLLHAADLAQAMILIAEKGKRLMRSSSVNGAPQGYYFASDKIHPTYAELGHLVADSLGRRTLILRAPKPAVWLAGGAATLMAQVTRRPAIFSVDKVREATAGSWTCSSELIRRELEFAPSAPLVERLRQTANWYRAEGWL